MEVVDEESDELSSLAEEQEEELKHFNKRVVTPTKIQVEATECGAVSLAIILAYYGKYVPVEELRIACNVSRDGSSAFNVIEAAQSYGLNAFAYSLELEDLPTANLPAVIFWEFEHFVVFEGCKKNEYYINDPASGPRKLTEEEFSQSFTGLLIELSPNENFVKSGAPPTLFSLLAKELNTIKLPLFFIIMTTAAFVIPGLALPALSQVFVDTVLTGNNFSWANGILVGIIGAIISMAALIYLQEKAFVYLGVNLSMRMSCKTLWHMLRLPIPFFFHRYPGEVAQRMSLIGSIAQVLTGNLGLAVVDLLLVVMYGGVIFYYNVYLALIVVASALLNLLILRLIFRARKNDLERFRAAFGNKTAYALSILENIETIKSMGSEQQSFSTWAGNYTKSTNAMQKVNNKDLYLIGISSLLGGVSNTAIIAIGGILLINEDLSIGMFIALQMLIANFSRPFNRLFNFNQMAQMLKVNLERLNDMMNYPIDSCFVHNPQANEETRDLFSSASLYKPLQGEIELKGVSYGYNPIDPPFLNDISLKLQPGKSCAMVGTTGCGKSTLVSLIAGLIYPHSGEILYDGIPRAQLPRQRLTSSLAHVEQAPFIFKGSVKDNLSLLNPLVSEEDLVQAAKDACIHDEIMTKRGGYDYELEANGANLSGGQRQRLEIARGLLKNPSILILDECTSALDSKTESILMSNIHRRGCAVLMIAHRLSSIKHCDEIYVMDKGQIVDVGTHEVLKSSSKIYKGLIEAENRTESGN